MKCLLDVSTLIALIWPSHVHHKQASAWREGKEIVLCPITELGFIRISTSAAFNASMAVLDGRIAPNSGKTTDWYLANLAAAHGMKWATLDQDAKHPAAELVG